VFSNLFVQTELVRPHQAIVCTRRPRSGGERPPWMIDLMTVHGTADGEPSYETSRAAFIGRGRSVIDPIAMHQAALTDSCGAVLDPIVAIRSRVVLEPDETARIHVVTGMAETRDAALGLIERYRDRHAADRVFELSWTHSQVVQRRLEATSAETQLYERLASNVLYANPTLRAPSSLLARNRGGQSGLWAYGISGDLPIVLVRIADVAHINLVRQLVKAHACCRLEGLSADLVVWNEDPSGYRQVLHDRIMSAIAASESPLDKPGGIFVRRSEQISDDDKVLMQTVARICRASYPALPRDPRVELDPRAFVHVGPAVDHAFLHEVSKIGEPELEPFYRFGGVDARALLELDDLGDQLPLAVRDTCLEILFVRSGGADGLGAGHEFSWSLAVVPCFGRSAISASVASMTDRHGVSWAGAGSSGSGPSAVQQLPHRLAPRIPTVWHLGHSRVSGAGPSASTLTRSSQAARSAGSGGVCDSACSTHATRARRLLRAASPYRVLDMVGHGRPGLIVRLFGSLDF
jgi:hypothetical protein